MLEVLVEVKSDVDAYIARVFVYFVRNMIGL